MKQIIHAEKQLLSKTQMEHIQNGHNIFASKLPWTYLAQFERIL